MLNSIRPTALTSLLAKGEVQNRMPSPQARRLRRPLLHQDSERSTNGMQRVIGEGMVGRCREVNQGSRAGNSDGVHGRPRPEEPCPEGDRASVGARKRGNARGAKGGRDVEAAESRSRTPKAGVVPERADRARDEILLPRPWLLASGPKKENERRAVGQRSHPGVRWRFARTESDHRLESRMREIRPSGSGGGVANNIATPTSFPGRPCGTETEQEFACSSSRSGMFQETEMHPCCAFSTFFCVFSGSLVLHRCRF